MARAVFINLPAHGHTNPTLPLVAELVRRGDEVCYYSFDEFQPAIERAGAQFRSYQQQLAVDHTRPDENLIRLASQLLEVTNTVVPQLLPQVQADRPDYLIHDSMAAWGKYIAQILRLPAICSTTTFAINEKIAMGTPAQALQLAGMLATALPDMRRFSQQAERLARRYLLPKPSPPEMFSNTSELTLVYTSRYLQPYGDSFPDSYAFVGPALDQARLAEEFPLPEGVPVVYISLGTLFNERIDFYQLCFAAFRDAAFHIVLSIGKKIALEALGPIPENFTVRNSVPQLAVLKRADAFITHGGMNSVHEALYLGVPLVVVPQAADQGFVARRVPEVGAGISLRNSALSARSLRRAVERLLADPRYRASAAVVGRSLREAGGPLRAADEIARFKQRRQIA